MENSIETFVLISTIVIGIFILITVYLIVKLKINDLLLKKSENQLKHFNETLQIMVAEKTMELVESEKRYKSLYELNQEVLENSPAGIIRLNHLMRVIYLNPEIISQLGIEVDFAKTLIGEQIKNFPHLEDAKLQNLLSEMKNDKEVRYELKLSVSERKMKYLEIKAVPLFENSRFEGAVLLVNDITKSIEAEEKLKQSYEILRTATGDIIKAMSSTSEMRDPYTAGHQKRVHELAVAIGQKMDISEEQLEALRFAGLIHDIGKVSVPSDILSKPGKISQMEFEVIKNHSQVGFDLLSKIEFPWPIARIVLQHHERLDGSGYPQGLKGNEILLEAKILAVADVVEAMNSHRPYRAALGIELALQEISKNKNSYYDPSVVDACISLFKEGNFHFTD
jgi:putative nucleotidyltransferase with HDIG domain/PAS domain S-box-containing protein